MTKDQWKDIFNCIKNFAEVYCGFRDTGIKECSEEKCLVTFLAESEEHEVLMEDAGDNMVRVNGRRIDIEGCPEDVGEAILGAST